MRSVSDRKCRLCGTVLSAHSTFCSRCGAAADHVAGHDDEELAGQLRTLFAGEIAIDREIGRGSMAVVYLAFDLELERRVAIKVLLPDVAGDSEIADRFRREAKLVAALNHPNIVPIHGVRNSPTLSAIVMQFVDGNSLDVVLRERGPSTLPVPLAALLLSQVASGLEHAHMRGVIHRDVKPANILLDPSGHVVVSDFGIARRHGATTVTGSGVLLGTASYMSPEQCLGRRAEAASDQYALGVVAFEVLAGRRPFLGRTSDVIRAHIADSPPRLSELRPDVPREIENFIMRMLEKDPATRHSSLRDAERFFRRFVVDESSVTTQLKQVSLPRAIEAWRPGRPVIGQSQAVVTAEERLPPSRSRSLSLLAAGAGLAALLIVGSIMLRPSPRIPPRSDRRPPMSTTLLTESSEKTNRVPDRVVVRSATPVRPKNEAAQDRTVRADPTTTPTGDSAVRTDSALTSSRPQGEVQSAAALAPLTAMSSIAPTVADARAAASEFLTLCNHRQWQDVERLSSLDGSADVRAQLVDLIRKAPDFQAGFERVASRPAVSDRTFTTDFILDLEWRGGERQLEVTVRAELSNGAWHLAGFGVRRPD